MYDYYSVLENIFEFKPEYIILTRLLSGDSKTFITCQNINGLNTPCIFINFQELEKFFSENNYSLVLKRPTNENLSNRFDSNIPENFRIHQSLNVVFKQTEFSS